MVEAKPRQQIPSHVVPEQRQGETIIATCAMGEIPSLVIPPDCDQRNLKLKARELQRTCRNSFLGGRWKCPRDCAIFQATE